MFSFCRLQIEVEFSQIKMLFFQIGYYDLQLKSRFIQVKPSISQIEDLFFQMTNQNFQIRLRTIKRTYRLIIHKSV